MRFRYNLSLVLWQFMIISFLWVTNAYAGKLDNPQAYSSSNESASTAVAHIKNITNIKPNNSESSTVLHPQYRSQCQSYSLMCNIKFGLSHAESEGKNGIMLSGYAYHFMSGSSYRFNLHVPDGQYDSLNEKAWGVGYTRNFYNPVYNSEYSLFALGLEDSFTQPQLQFGYFYQKYLNITTSGFLKIGMGYSAFIWAKPSFCQEFPLPLPGVGLVLSLKIGSGSLMFSTARTVELLTLNYELN